MPLENTDRRIRRSQEALIHALLDLIETRHYDQISVQDITQKANVGRSTFYAHYQDKDDLLISGFEHLLDELVEQISLDENQTLIFKTDMFFRHAGGHYEIYQTLLWGSGFKLLTRDAYAALCQKIEERLRSLLPSESIKAIPLAVVANSMGGGLLLLLKWWLDHKMPYPPEQMDVFFQQLVMSGVQQSLPGTNLP